MAKPPPTPPSSDIKGVDQDFHAGQRPAEGDPEDMKRVEEGPSERRAKPPSESGTEAIGD